MVKLTRDERIRRAALLCCHFTRNLAYFRAGGTELDFRKSGDFWKTENGDFIDIAVLEWCKLFGDDADKHHWKRVIKDRAAFRSELCQTLDISYRAWKRVWKSVRTYRNKFVAHLDSERVMNIPDMDLPQQMVIFYFDQLKLLGSHERLLSNMPENMNAYYQACYDQAVDIYHHIKSEGYCSVP